MSLTDVNGKKGDTNSGWLASLKAVEPLLVAVSTAASAIGVVYLIFQVDIMKEQMSVYSGQVARDIQKAEFDRSIALIQVFEPKYDLSKKELDYRDGNLVLSFDIQNLGDSSLVVAPMISYDLVRCINEKFWDGKTWSDVEQVRASEPIVFEETSDGYTLGADYSQLGTSIAPGRTDTVERSIEFPISAFASFQQSEGIALQMHVLVYEQGQYAFKEEIEELGLVYGPKLNFRGKPVLFPAIRQRISYRQNLELLETDWTESSRFVDCDTTI